MREADTEKLLELKTWMGTLPGVEDQDTVEVRSWFCVSEYTESDYEALSATLADVDSTAGFAFCARDVDRYGDAMESLAAAGHEIVFHGNRHTMFADLSYETAHEYIATGLDRIEEAAGVRPTGFFVPWMDASQGTLDAAGELGIEWMFADPEAGATVPDSVTVTQPVMPPDSVRLEQGAEPAAMMDDFSEQATADNSFLFHPPFLEYYDATEQFEDWLADTRPVTMEAHLAGEGVGIVFDAIQPLRLE